MAMIRPETEMKDSGIEWIGDIPNNWETIPLKKIVVDRAGGAWGNEPYENNSTICMRIADFDFDRGVFQDKSETELTKRSYKEYQIDKLLLQTNDICIEKSGGGEKTPVGRAVLFDKPYDALFANFMDRIRVDNAVSFPKYVEYYLRAMYFLSVTTLYIKQTTGIQNLNVTSLLEKEVITLPSLSEQQAIVDYLDETCSKIEEIIAEAKASIEEYKELKQSILFETMTRGIQSDRKYKTCDYEWLGKVPEDWSLMKITHILDDNDSYPIGDGDHGLIKTDSYKSEGIPYIRVQNIGWGTPLLMDNVVYISKEDNEKIKGSQLKPGDVLFVKTGATIGKTAIVPNNIPISNTTSHVGKITVSKEHNSKYIFYLLSSFIGYKQFWDIACMKATRPELSISEIKQMKVLIPSTRDEEDEIVEYLDNKLPEYETLICIKESLINDLEAYKKSLIYEVVTGKRRVV